MDAAPRDASWIDPQVRRLAPRVAVLQIGAALTEGLGLILLVPLLGIVSGSVGRTGGQARYSGIAS